MQLAILLLPSQKLQTYNIHAYMHVHWFYILYTSYSLSENLSSAMVQEY